MSGATDWRELPPTSRQRRVLERIGNELGWDPGVVMTRGEATDVISGYLATRPELRQAFDRAGRKRGRHRRGIQAGERAAETRQRMQALDEECAKIAGVAR